MRHTESGLAALDFPKINGKWMLFEYEYKKNQLSYEFDSKYLKKSKNEVEIEVE